MYLYILCSLKNTWQQASRGDEGYLKPWAVRAYHLEEEESSKLQLEEINIDKMIASLYTHYIVSCQVMNYYAHAYYDYSVCNTHTFTHDVTPQVLAWRIKVRLTVSEFLTLAFAPRARSYPLLHWTIGSPSWRDDIIQSWDPFDFSHQPTQHAEVGRKNRTEGTRVQKSLYYEK